jgi:trk system potassium uptake protein TrkA
MNILVIGAGQVGFYLSQMLSRENHDVTLIEPDTNRYHRAREQLDVMVIQGSGSSAATLKQAGIEKCDMIAAVSGVDEVNIVSCLLASKYNVNFKVARVQNPEFSQNTSVLTAKDLGIDLMIHPEEETAREIVLLIRRAAATDVVEFENGRIQVVGVRIDASAPILNKTLKEISEDNPDKSFRTVAIFRDGRTIIPGGQDFVRRKDQIFVVAKTESVSQVLELCGKGDERLQRVMILGGGRVGRSVAWELEREKDIDVKLIETSQTKSEFVAGQLRRTLVIRGDGTDMDLLATEGVMDQDGFIAVSDDEETNILSCLLSKHLGVRRTIAMVNRADYLPIMSSIGLDAAVDKRIITADAILRFIRRGKVVSVATLRGVEAEVLEIETIKNASITNKPLKLTKFPKGAIIGIVSRDGSVFVPVGDTIMKPGDKAVVFALPDNVPKVEKLFT